MDHAFKRISSFGQEPVGESELPLPDADVWLSSHQAAFALAWNRNAIAVAEVLSNQPSRICRTISFTHTAMTFMT